MRAALLAALLAAAAPAGAVWDDTGGAAMQFLRLGPGARALGMGEAYGPVAGGADAVYWNPGAMALTPRPELAYSHSEMLSFLHLEHVAYAMPVETLGGAMGFAATFFHQDSIPLVTNTDQNIGSFSPHSEAFSLAYARRLSVGEDTHEREHTFFQDAWRHAGAWEPLNDEPEMWTGSLSWGLAAKYLSDTIYDKTAWAAAVDAGVLFHPIDLSQASLSAVLRNLGTRPKFNLMSEPLPLEGTLGAAYRVDLDKQYVLPAFELAVPGQGKPYAKLGAEYSFPVGDFWRAALRGGYKTLTAPDLGYLTGLTGGVGLSNRNLSIDLAFQPMAVLGETFRGSLAWRFDTADRPVVRHGRVDGMIHRPERRPQRRRQVKDSEKPEAPVEIEEARPHY